MRWRKIVPDILATTGEVIPDDSPFDADRDFTEDPEPEMDLVVDAD